MTLTVVIPKEASRLKDKQVIAKRLKQSGIEDGYFIENVIEDENLLTYYVNCNEWEKNNK